MACVAILAFLGHLSEKNATVTHAHIISLLCFSFGCVMVAVCLFFSYLAQGKFTHVIEKIMTVSRDEAYKADEKRGRFFNIIAILFGGLCRLAQWSFFSTFVTLIFSSTVKWATEKYSFVPHHGVVDVCEWYNRYS